ncbi:MAG: hypothetical protein AB7N65_08550 [Vicinamibacterales bacterium]
MESPSNTPEQPSSGRPPLVITSETEFESLIATIDNELIQEGVPVPARALKAGLKVTSKYDIVLEVFPQERQIKPGVFTPDQISLRIHEWMKKRYGDKFKVDFTLGRVAFPFRGALYAIRCPTVLGTARFVCEPKTVGQPRNPLGVNTVPVLNILDLIDGFTADMAASLTGEEAVRIVAAFSTGSGTFLALQALKDVHFVGEATGDIHAAANHLLSAPQQLGLSRWASLQAVEKLWKAYIKAAGGTVKTHHKLDEHAQQAARLGLPAPPPKYVAAVQCSAGVRYGEVPVAVEETVKAHLVSLEICEVAAQSIGGVLRRPVPRSAEPLVDGVSHTKFVKALEARTMTNP